MAKVRARESATLTPGRRKSSSFGFIPLALVTHNNAYKRDSQWVETGAGYLADGTKTTFTSTLAMSDDGNTMTATGTGSVGDKKTDDQHDVWRRVSKFSSRSATKSQPSAEIPKKAREAMSFFVGNWEAESYENDTKTGTSEDRRSWAPGKHCLTIEWSGTHDGVPWRASGITGWDAKASAVVEYWHGSQGQSLTIIYPLDKMTPEAWEGTSCFTTADGTSSEGPCRLTRTPEWIPICSPDRHATARSPCSEVSLAGSRIRRRPSIRPSRPMRNRKISPKRPSGALKYFVGTWEGEDNSDGQDLGTNRVRRYWSPGKTLPEDRMVRRARRDPRRQPVSLLWPLWLGSENESRGGSLVRRSGTNAYLQLPNQRDEGKRLGRHVCFHHRRRQ